MAGEVELRARAQIDDIIADFERLNTKVADVQNTLKSTGTDVTENFNAKAKETESFLGKLRSLGGRVADQIKQDFKTLVSVNAMKDALNLSNQFRGSIGESIKLGDTIRKLGPAFQIADKDFSKFQGNMAKGLGQLGLSSTVATSAMEGLADTPVRGEKALMGYAKTAGQLASLSNQMGKEGDIAKGIAEVLRAKGIDPNDVTAMEGVAEDLRRTFNVTGKMPTETLSAMKDIFSQMPSEMRKTISTRALAGMAAAGQAAGPNSTKFLQEYMGMSKIQRSSMDAQGFKGVMTPEGIDLDKFQKAAKDVLGRIGGDPRMAAKTLGLSDDAADGFVRLAESMDQVKKAQDQIAQSTGNITDQYRASMGTGEAFRANINRIKSYLAEPLAKAQGMLTNGLGAASESDMGAGAVVAGGGLLAAVLAGVGARGIGAGMLGGLAKKQGTEALTGEKVQNVYVVNASEIASGGLMGQAGKAGGMLGTIGKGLGAASAGLMGYEVGSMLNEGVVSRTEGTTSEGFEGNAVERLIFKMDQLLGGDNAKQFNKAQDAMAKPPQKVIVESRTKDFKVSPASRGGSW
jgi:hypothetical protein